MYLRIGLILFFYPVLDIKQSTITLRSSNCKLGLMNYVGDARDGDTMARRDGRHGQSLACWAAPGLPLRVAHDGEPSILAFFLEVQAGIGIGEQGVLV
jgi:hypothetical protein